MISHIGYIYGEKSAKDERRKRNGKKTSDRGRKESARKLHAVNEEIKKIAKNCVFVSIHSIRVIIGITKGNTDVDTFLQ